MATTRPSSAPTLEDVADAAGLSRATVSRVINGGARVSPEAMSAIQEAIARLNYVPNRAARSLAIRQTMALALVIPEDTTRFFGDPYFARIIDGITHVTGDTDYVLTLTLAAPGDKTARYLLSGSVDGAIVVSHHLDDSFVEQLEGHLPVVFNGRPSGGETHYVDVDNVAGAQLATQHLVSIGRSRIAMIAGRLDMLAANERVDGWRGALTAASLESSRLAEGDYTILGGARAMRQLLAEHPDLDAVFVSSDLMALGALTELRLQGRRVPQDVAVVGYDDSIAASQSDIPLTTVRQPAEQMGQAAAEMLLGLIRGEDVPPHRVLPTQLVRRETA